MTKPSAKKDDSGSRLPVQVELYIEPDGTVTFADLAAELLPVARSLNPEAMPSANEPAKTKPEGQA
jgi:hypothetical protein